MTDVYDILPTIEVKTGEKLIDALVRIKFATSKREAKHLIQAGAVRLIKIK
jgi:tyrosyl-tRNA synthetase